jgi:hypothetical protein
VSSTTSRPCDEQWIGPNARRSRSVEDENSIAVGVAGGKDAAGLYNGLGLRFFFAP